MTTIEIGNVFSKLVDASPEAIRAVDAALAVPTPNYNFSAAYKSGKWDGMTRFYRVATNRFPSGLLMDVVRALRLIRETYEIRDTRIPMDADTLDSITLLDVGRGTITLRDYQLESVHKGLEATRGIINVATNGGKTEIACGIIKSVLPYLGDGKKIVFFTHAKEIFYQSQKRIQERLDIEVGLIGDEIWDEKPVTVVMIPTVGKYLTVPSTLPKNPKRTKLENDIKKIGKSNPDKAKELRDEISLIEKDDWARIKGNVKKTKALLASTVVFIADEVHHASSDTWYDIFMKLENCYYRFGLTGTVDESDAINLKRLYGCTGKIVTKISNQFLIDNGYSAKPTVYMLSGECEDIDYGDWRDAIEEGIIRNDVRNMAFLNKVRERADSGCQCLIIVNETTHGDEVVSILSSLGIESEFTHGQKSTKYRKEVLDQLKSGDLRVLVATSVLDEGVDVSGINCLFLMAGGKSMRQLLQRIGRGLRKKADGSGLEVYDFLDYHNKYLTEHTLERYETYKSEGFDIVRL